jgi:lipopolysaccharide-induced tumor necrosis factor-alpha factor
MSQQPQVYYPAPPPPAQPQVVYQQPPQVYIQSPMPQQQVMMAAVPTQTVILTTNAMTRFPYQCTCPVCRNNIVTRTESVPGACTFLSCFGCLLIGCWLGCCLIPFCVPELEDTVHSCPNCNAFIAKNTVL